MSKEPKEFKELKPSNPDPYDRLVSAPGAETGMVPEKNRNPVTVRPVAPLRDGQLCSNCTDGAMINVGIEDGKNVYQCGQCNRRVAI